LTAGRHSYFRTDIGERPDRDWHGSLAIVCPNRGVATADDGPPTDLNSIGEVDFVAGRYDASRAKHKRWIGFVNNVRIRDRIDLVQSYNFSVSAQIHFVAATKDIQVTNAHVIS
jgi:hypothetical protein